MTTPAPRRGPTPKTLAEKVQGKFRVDESTGCWIWTAAFNSTGYGRLREHPSNRTLLAHRVMYELHVGAIPDGLVLDHLCRVRACVNPSHLQPVSFAENVRRGEAVKTHCPQGHPYEGANLGWSLGQKRCLACHRERQRKYYHRTKDGAA